jgi:hypothetical protein
MGLENYDDVIKYLIKKKRTSNLLLGNGFSMAYNEKIFSYNALHDLVVKTKDPILSKIFNIVKTKNFELIMHQLDSFCELIEAFSKDKSLLAQVKEASLVLKKSLLKAVEEMHPEHVFKISDEELHSCVTFLKPYMDKGGSIFSNNYDLLLYWVLMRGELENSDGFGKDRMDDPEDKKTDPTYSDELYWGRNLDTQCIYYLHGALQLFDAGIEIVKEQYNGEYLLTNIKERMENGEYPIFVAAGSGEEKLSYIMHNRYLSNCYEALSNITGSLVTFGFNFGQYDEHIIDAINKAARPKKNRAFKDKLWSVYIGIFSDADFVHIESIKHKFRKGLKICLFDAKKTKVWR